MTEDPRIRALAHRAARTPWARRAADGAVYAKAEHAVHVARHLDRIAGPAVALFGLVRSAGGRVPPRGLGVLPGQVRLVRLVEWRLAVDEIEQLGLARESVFADVWAPLGVTVECWPADAAEWNVLSTFDRLAGMPAEPLPPSRGVSAVTDAAVPGGGPSDASPADAPAADLPTPVGVHD